MKSNFVALILALLCFTGKAQKKKTTTSASEPFVLGRIEKIVSKELSEPRTLNIYLPPGYKDNDTTHYPVIYLLDGSADEDFIHIVGLVQFYSFSWIKRIPECIVVGIANVDRKRNFTFPTSIEDDRKKYPATGHSAAFISFLEKELQPFIQNKYRGNRRGMLIGQSLGGLLATEVLLDHTALFDQYVIISPSLWWNNGTLLDPNKMEKIKTFAGKTNVYIAVGKEGLTPGNTPRVMEVDANLLADQLKGLQQKNMNIYFDYLPGEDHGTIMHQAVSNAFKTLYPAAESD